MVLNGDKEQLVSSGKSKKEQEDEEKEIFEEAFKRAKGLAREATELADKHPISAPGAKKPLTGEALQKRLTTAYIRPFINQIKQERRRTKK